MACIYINSFFFFLNLSEICENQGFIRHTVWYDGSYVMYLKSGVGERSNLFEKGYFFGINVSDC